METSSAGMKVEVCVHSLRSKLGLEYKLYVCETLDKSGELAALGSVFMMVFCGDGVQITPQDLNACGFEIQPPTFEVLSALKYILKIA